MRYSDDRHGSKFLFLAIVIVVIYLAFFNFDAHSAYEYTLVQLRSLMSLLPSR